MSNAAVAETPPGHPVLKSIPTTNAVPRPMPAFPLSTQGRWIVDAHGKRVKLASVNWFGAESPEFVVGGLDKASLSYITTWIAGHGFNSLRLPWSNEMVEKNPVVKSEYLSANPDLKGLRALEIYDRVIAAAARQGLMVVLDNHRSSADWCCDEKHGDGLWHSPAHPESAWVKDWKTMAARYRSQPAVVAAELRNEIRPDPAVSKKKPSWGDGDPVTDWKRAAELGGNAVLASNPNLLVVIGGLEYQGNLEPIFTNPARLSRTDKTVYAGHDYSWFHSKEELANFSAFRESMDRKIGAMVAPDAAVKAPLYLDEFGTCGDNECNAEEIKYAALAAKYLRQTDADWAYWPVNGTQSAGYDRAHGDPENYGVLDDSWQRNGHDEILGYLMSVQKARQGPGINHP
ncbi:MAG: glycoside hydrolase family 5 protein [Mycobacteriales bacterium]